MNYTPVWLCSPLPDMKNFRCFVSAMLLLSIVHAALINMQTKDDSTNVTESVRQNLLTRRRLQCDSAEHVALPLLRDCRDAARHLLPQHYERHLFEQGLDPDNDYILPKNYHLRSCQISLYFDNGFGSEMTNWVALKTAVNNIFFSCLNSRGVDRASRTGGSCMGGEQSRIKVQVSLSRPKGLQ